MKACFVSFYLEPCILLSFERDLLFKMLNYFFFHCSTFMFRAFRKWIRARRQQQVEEDQEASSTETWSGNENLGAEAASAASLTSEHSLSNHGNPFLPEEGGPIHVFEDPEVERSGPEYFSTPQPGLRPLLREREPVSSVRTSSCCYDFMISEPSAGPSQIADRGDKHPFRLIGPEYVACCPRQVKRLAERSTAYFPCSRCNSPLVRLIILIIYPFLELSFIFLLCCRLLSARVTALKVLIRLSFLAAGVQATPLTP